MDVDDLECFVEHPTIRAAACSGKVEVLKFFEERLKRDWFEEALLKSDRNVLGETIIHDLAYKGHLEMLKHLCQKAPFRNSIQRNSGDITPIHYAAFRGHLDIVKFLALHTSNPNVGDKDSHTPIHYAAVKGHLEIVKFLVSMASNPITANKYGCTPIHFAAGEGHI